MPLVNGEEIKFTEAHAKLKDARLYRRFWGLITVNLGILTADLYKVLPHHNGEVSLKVGIPLLIGGFATLGSFTQILDSSILVDGCVSAVRLAQRDVTEMQAQRLLQPELELQT